MKLLIISPLSKTLQDEYYAPVERHCYHVALELKQRGHEVSVLALKGSQLGEGIELVEAEDNNEEKAFNSCKERLKEFDCLLDFSNLKYSYLFKHDEAKDLKIIGCCYPYQASGYTSAPPLQFPNWVVTSEAMGQELSKRLGVSYRVVHYGVSKVAGSNPARGERMLYLGRVMKEKGVQLAVDLAKRTRIGLDILGEDVSVPDPTFIVDLLRRCDGRLIRMYGRSNESLKHELLSKAKCLVLPYLSDSMAMACLPILEAFSHGVPVIAFRRGAVEEFIVNRANGIIVDTLDELPLALEEIDKIDSATCVETAEGFSLSNAVDSYESLIKSVVQGDEW